MRANHKLNCVFVISYLFSLNLIVIWQLKKKFFRNCFGLLNLNADIFVPEHDYLFLSVLINQTTNYFGAFPNGVQKKFCIFLYNEEMRTYLSKQVWLRWLNGLRFRQCCKAGAFIYSSAVPGYKFESLAHFHFIFQTHTSGTNAAC